jgi:hypothetical protein
MENFVFNEIFVLPIWNNNCYMERVLNGPGGKSYLRTIFMRSKSINHLKEQYGADNIECFSTYQGSMSNGLLCTVFNFQNYRDLVRIPMRYLLFLSKQNDELISATTADVIVSLFGNIPLLNVNIEKIELLKHTLHQRKGLKPTDPEPNITDAFHARLSMSPF